MFIINKQIIFDSVLSFEVFTMVKLRNGESNTAIIQVIYINKLNICIQVYVTSSTISANAMFNYK